ncbi:MAG: hypothetical protein CMC78_03775 [Flavobacteriaceae bacterium]|nr:hypothetical protein [Flavobacteriaceae bacterium]
MSKKIHQELCRIAKEILEKDKTLDLDKVYDQTLSLFEKLILIKYSEELSGDLSDELDLKYDNTIDFIKADDKENMEADFQKIDSQDQLNLNNSVKDIVKETQEKTTHEAQMAELTNQDLSFEPKEKLSTQKEIIKERLNDKFSKGLQIDLNDRLAFIKHLFDKRPNEYQRAISQISTFQSWNQAKVFILEMVKPDYDNWKGKELYEERFLKIIENNF